MRQLKMELGLIIKSTHIMVHKLIKTDNVLHIFLTLSVKLFPFIT